VSGPNSISVNTPFLEGQPNSLVSRDWYRLLIKIAGQASQYNPPVTITLSASGVYAVGANDYTIISNYTGTLTLTLPPAVGYPGRPLIIRTIKNQAVISDAANVVPLAGGIPGTAILSSAAGKFAYLQSDGVSWQTMMAN
jgi:hypothetical protein